MATPQTQDAPREPAVERAERRAARRAARLARQIRSFAGAHGGAVDGSLEYLGQRGTRIVLVGADGAWGDLVARDQPTARRAVELAGVTVHDQFSGEPAARLRTGPYEWRRMAGIQGPRRGTP
ncbi:hypothetical protein AQ490_03310 [Wenjunlia vitaminophila]|uniref:Uncharacterized protein n=1 Tax=Wenjunlia vitaminophila TaxID=76728 RepID=A0A0T6LTV8_WENVI|nr:hypothetical protein [Wenjunlia vitaminophila]KRV49244.1 hypothetical protein AQ490_03310 [Wenjunlia vitaminophila]